MHFLNPSALYLLAFIPIVALLHFLKLRRQRHVVPSVMLWLEAIEDMKANVPFQRLRNSLLLPLQMLFLLVVIGGVARPALRRPGALGAQSILIIDTSASMQATHPGKSRLDAAKAEALKLIDRLGAEGQMMIMDTSRPPGNIRQAFTSDARTLRQAVESLPAQHISPDLKAVFDAVRVYPNTGIFFISDDFDKLPDTANQAAVHKIGVGERSDNVGIVQFNVARDSTLLNQYQVLVGLQSFAEAAKEFQVRLEIEGNAIDDKMVALPAKEAASIVFPFEDARLDGKRFDGEIVSVRLDIDDDLPLDNVAWAVLHPPPRWKVLLVSDRDAPLLRAMLKTNPHVDLDGIQTADYHGVGDYDVLIFDQFVPETLPEGNIIFLNPIAGLPFMPVEINAQPVRVIDQHPTHEVMRDVSLIDLEVSASLRCQVPLWGIPLVETTQTPLIWIGAKGERQVVVFAFDPFDLDISHFAFFERSVASSPILMSQCLEWLGSTTAPIQPDVVKVGEPVRIRVAHPGAVERMAIQLPDGTRSDLDGRASSVVFSETTQIGVYTVFIDEEQFGRFAVNLLNAQESDLSPPQFGRNHGEIAAADGARAQSDVPEVSREMWRYAAFLGLLLLGVEWWVYHRNP
ncbi:MAG: BatA and WFA domain-containing protein [Candidatus Poribacteria bacterium]|nr:BatA and WFA domain-containing protein [Candidatus Poribacteria bacterium]